MVLPLQITPGGIVVCILVLGLGLGSGKLLVVVVLSVITALLVAFMFLGDEISEIFGRIIDSRSWPLGPGTEKPTI